MIPNNYVVKEHKRSDPAHVILLKGLPGSGKSTWAREIVRTVPGWKRINKDDLRSMMDDGSWSKGNEKMIVNARNALILSCVTEGYGVIVDDTNFHLRHEETIHAMIPSARLDIVSFEDVPIEECIRRDLIRPNSVGQKVIRQMYNQFLRPEPTLPVWDPTLPNAVLCDLDGTIALFGKANPYDRDFMDDRVNAPVRAHLQMIRSSSVFDPPKIIMVSGRNGKFEPVTRLWLEAHDIPFDYLFMRQEKDMRKDNVVKKEIYDQMIVGKYNVLYVLDDRNQVVDLWRSLGLPCFQVAEGDF